MVYWLTLYARRNEMMFYSSLPSFSPRFRRRLALALLLCTVVPGGLVAGPSAQAQEQLAPSSVIDAGAKIHITVAGEPDLSNDYAVDSAGNVTLLYVNQVHVGGQTAPQASKTLARALAKFYRNPQVVVTQISAGGISVELTGAVSGQGTRVVRSDARLNDVLQQAGPGLDADLAKVQVTHGQTGQAHTTDAVNYLSFLNTQDATGNPLLRNGDVIYVPRRDAVPILVVVRGEVAKPGREQVPAKSTVYDALQAAGGLVQDANRQGIYLQHANTAQQSLLNYDAMLRNQTDAASNPLLLDGDILVVKAANVPNVYTITGSVRNPSQFPLNTPNFTLADAIGQAGGLGDRPQLKEITIIRKPGSGRVQTVKLDASDPTVQGNTIIQPGDNINIPQGKAGTKIDALTGIGILVSIFGILRR